MKSKSLMFLLEIERLTSNETAFLLYMYSKRHFVWVGAYVSFACFGLFALFSFLVDWLVIYVCWLVCWSVVQC